MGPFVPDLISDQLNLIVALLLGIGFGFVLEQAGFSSSRRLAGVFYGYDFTVLRVFFTAAVTAMSGVLLLEYFGLLDTDAIFVNPTWLLPAVVGGAIMGVGFILGGYCPGTSVCAAAIGKVDAMFFVGGGILGVFGFAELYPLYKHFNDSTLLGPIKVFDSLGISQGLFAFILIVVAVGAFYATTLIEKKVDKKSAPSLAFNPSKHFAAGIGVIRVECERCHTSMPHNDDVLNKHTLKVACQTCHIPTYAKVNPTKLYWDWSTAGKLKDGKPYEVTDSSGSDVYMSIKGSFIWGKKLKPDYIWFNGTASHYLVGDTFDPSKPVKMNELYGTYDDPDSKIYPVKIHRAKQIYDATYNYLIQPKTFSTKPGDGGFWKEFNWQRSAEEGMKLVNLPYSGKYGFVETEMYWPINHMVSSKTATVKCLECHTRENGRLANVGGFYMPGRDFNPWVEYFGGGILLLTIGAVVLHGGVRIAASRKGKEKK